MVDSAGNQPHPYVQYKSHLIHVEKQNSTQ